MKQQHDIEELELQISNYLSGHCTDSEKEDLFAVLAADDEATKTFQAMSATWAISSVPAFAKHEDENLLLIKKRISSAASSSQAKPAKRVIPLWLKAAAIITLILGCNYFWYNYTETLTETYTNEQFSYEIKVPAGSRTHIMLPDGTEATLNAGSVLRYGRGFGIGERSVTLNGEGYFKVAKNKEIPFLVKANDIVVRVVGTTFNVLAYDDDSFVKVSLLEGRVNLSSVSGTMMKLYPNEQACYNKTTGQMRKMKVNVSKACDWLDGSLSFDNVSFDDIARRLERKYLVKIRIESERLKAEHFSGCFSGNQDINDILKEINVENQYTWKVSGDTILITDKRKEGKTRK